MRFLGRFFKGGEGEPMSHFVAQEAPVRGPIGESLEAQLLASRMNGLNHNRQNLDLEVPVLDGQVEQLERMNQQANEEAVGYRRLDHISARNQTMIGIGRVRRFQASVVVGIGDVEATLQITPAEHTVRRDAENAVAKAHDSEEGAGVAIARGKTAVGAANVILHDDGF